MLVKQADFGFIVKLEDVVDIWIYFRIQQMWVYIMEIIIQLFSVLVRCHVENLKSPVLGRHEQIAVKSNKGNWVERRI